MLLLEAINEILPKLGEHPVTSVDDRSPTLAVVIPEINSTKRNLLTIGWWFNEWEATLWPNPEGVVGIPIDTLRFISGPTQPAAVRGNYLLNLKTGTNKWTEPVKGMITVNVPFEELPESAAQLVLYRALVTAYGTDIGLEQVLQLWTAKESAALAAFESEHLQNKRYSTQRSRHFQNIVHSLRGH